MRWFRAKPKKQHAFTVHAPRGIVDLHAHVLPGVDDGAKDMAEAVAMLDALQELGVVKVAATPHFDASVLQPDAAAQRTLIAALSVQRQDRPPAVTVGAEIVFDDVFLQQEAEGGVPGLGEQSIYLVEFGFLPGMVSSAMEERVFRFQASAKQLLLAHPERISDIQKDVDRVAALRRSGMLMQMDVMALVGRYGRRARDTAYEMLDRELYDVAATDLHHLEDVDMLSEAFDALVDWDVDVFNRLVSINPSRIIEGKVEEIVFNA